MVNGRTLHLKINLFDKLFSSLPHWSSSIKFFAFLCFSYYTINKFRIQIWEYGIKLHIYSYSSYFENLIYFRQWTYSMIIYIMIFEGCLKEATFVVFSIFRVFAFQKLGGRQNPFLTPRSFTSRCWNAGENYFLKFYPTPFIYNLMCFYISYPFSSSIFI